MANLERAYAADVRIRIADQKLPAEGVAVIAEEFSSDGVVYERNGVRVTAFEVDHGAEIKPAYGYRIDYRGRSVLISGDTRFSENLIRNGKGVDLLVHAVASSKPELLQNIVIRRILDHHTMPGSGNSLQPHAAETCRLYTFRSAGNANRSGAHGRGDRRRNAKDVFGTAASRRGLDEFRHHRRRRENQSTAAVKRAYFWDHGPIERRGRLSATGTNLPIRDVRFHGELEGKRTCHGDSESDVHGKESRCGAVAVGRTYLLPPLSSGGALVVRP